MNQPAVNGGFAPRTLFLGLAASSLASSFLKTEELSARSFLLWGLPAALGLCLLSALGRLGAAGGRIGPLLPGTLVAGRAGGSALCSGACPAAALAEFISGIVPFYRGRFWADTLPGIFRTDLSLPAAAVAQGGLDAAGQLWGAGCVLLWNGAFIWRTAGERPARL